jgi:hypothetical protein
MNEFSANESIQSQNSSPVTNDTAEEIRKKYINHETNVMSIGVLYYISSIILVTFGIFTVFNPKIEPVRKLLTAVFSISLGIFQFCVGTGLRKLKSWARISTSILSGIGLLGFPIGTLINGYILYLVLCKKSATVFSCDYQQVIAATPQVKYKTSIIVWILLGILIVIVLLVIFSVLLQNKRMAEWN